MKRTKAAKVEGMKLPVKRKSFSVKEWADRMEGLAELERELNPQPKTGSDAEAADALARASAWALGIGGPYA